MHTLGSAWHARPPGRDITAIDLRLRVTSSFGVLLACVLSWLVAGCAANSATRVVVSNELYEAIEKDDLDTVRRLVVANPGVAHTRYTIANWTPLHHVMHAGRTQALSVTSVLLEHGADPNARDAERNTPLHLAGYRVGRREALTRDVYLGIIVALLDRKADVSARNHVGVTPLHLWTLRNAHAAAVELLLVQGADVNARATQQGWTPLHGAASSGRADLVALLLRKGADPTARDSAGLTPLQAAERAGRPQAVEALRGR